MVKLRTLHTSMKNPTKPYVDLDTGDDCKSCWKQITSSSVYKLLCFQFAVAIALAQLANIGYFIYINGVRLSSSINRNYVKGIGYSSDSSDSLLPIINQYHDNHINLNFDYIDLSDPSNIQDTQTTSSVLGISDHNSDSQYWNISDSKRVYIWYNSPYFTSNQKEKLKSNQFINLNNNLSCRSISGDKMDILQYSLRVSYYNMTTNNSDDRHHNNGYQYHTQPIDMQSLYYIVFECIGYGFYAICLLVVWGLMLLAQDKMRKNKWIQNLSNDIDCKCNSKCFKASCVKLTIKIGFSIVGFVFPLVFAVWIYPLIALDFDSHTPCLSVNNGLPLSFSFVEGVFQGATTLLLMTIVCAIPCRATYKSAQVYTALSGCIILMLCLFSMVVGSMAVIFMDRTLLYAYCLWGIIWIIHVCSCHY